jgi:kinesin family protein 5
MQQGALNRAVAATGMNEGSSRSHSVFMVTVEQRNLETNNQKAGKMFLVDLAGSEMVKKMVATSPAAAAAAAAVVVVVFQ